MKFIFVLLAFSFLSISNASAEVNQLKCMVGLCKAGPDMADCFAVRELPADVASVKCVDPWHKPKGGNSPVDTLCAHVSFSYDDIEGEATVYPDMKYTDRVFLKGTIKSKIDASRNTGFNLYFPKTTDLFNADTYIRFSGEKEQGFLLGKVTFMCEASK